MTALQCIGTSALIIAATFGMTAAMSWRLGMARTDRRRLLGLLAEFGPLDGGHLLSITPLSKETIAARMAELEQQGLVERVASARDPFWRDVWRVTP